MAAECSEADVERGGQAIRRGELVAFPTETVYGLGADATNGQAVAGLFAAKARPRINPLIVHLPTADAAWAYGRGNDLSERLAQRFWPGPLTLVLNRCDGGAISDLVSAGLETIALRVPNHRVAQALLAQAGVPIAAPSANRSGHVSATTAAHVRDDLATRIAVILDGGPTPLGLESTVIDLSTAEPVLLRPGAISRAEIESVLQEEIQSATPGDQPRSPGQMAQHYAPRAKLRLDAAGPEPGEAFLAFGPSPQAEDALSINLSPAGDLKEAAANLFAALRTLDASGATTIAVAPIPTEGLGEAITDRLTRAAAPGPG